MKLQDRAALIPDLTPNKRGHDKKHPRFISVMNPHEAGKTHDDLGHKAKSWAVYKMHDKIRALSNSPERFPDLGFIPTERPVKKHNDQFIKIRRSDPRESIVNVAQYFLAFLDPISRKVGIRAGKSDGSFLTLDRDHILETTGLTYDSFNEAVKVMEDFDMVERQRCWKEKDDGTYGGRPSLYTLKEAFFEQFGIIEEFKNWASYTYKKAREVAGGQLAKIAEGLATQFDGKSKSKPAQKQSGTFEPEEGTMMFYQNKLPKSKRGSFIETVCKLITDNPDMPKSAIYPMAYQSV